MSGGPKAKVYVVVFVAVVVVVRNGEDEDRALQQTPETPLAQLQAPTASARDRDHRRRKCRACRTGAENGGPSALHSQSPGISFGTASVTRKAVGSRKLNTKANLATESYGT